VNLAPKEDVMSVTNLTVPVPTDRVAEFYRWFADWVDGSPPPRAVEPPPPGENVEAAVKWWQLLKPREREIFGLWIDIAPKMVTASDIVEKLGLKGPRDIPGILSWPRRKGQKAGFAVQWSFRYDALTEEPIYGIEDAEYADVLRHARSTAEGA
jgi:hypothetical protein